MSFKKNNYLVIRKAFAPELMNFCDHVLKIRRNAKHVLDQIPNFYGPVEAGVESWLGTFKDAQVPNVFSVYGDPAMETLLLMAHPLLEDKTKIKLHPCYSYARIYEKGSDLKKHLDRPSCEISCTVNMGGDMWPIYLKNGKKKIKVELKRGDLLIYKGTILKHWREKFEGNECTQVFLHYVDANGKYKEHAIDKRRSFGIPAIQILERPQNV